MSILNCFFDNRFQCEENVINDEKKYAYEKTTAIRVRTQTKRWITNLKKEDEKLKKELWDAEHYRFMYEDLPNPEDVKDVRPKDTRTQMREQFGESATQYVTNDPTKFEFNTIGLTNWRIPRNIFEKLLAKHPIELYDETERYIDNAALRFYAEINMSLYWNSAIYAIKTKTRWVIAFWPKGEDKILFADPITKKIWIPVPSKPEDNPEVMIA